MSRNGLSYIYSAEGQGISYAVKFNGLLEKQNLAVLEREWNAHLHNGKLSQPELTVDISMQHSLQEWVALDTRI